MEKKTTFQMLSETQDKLDDLHDVQAKILQALDIIELKRHKAKGTCQHLQRATSPTSLPPHVPGAAVAGDVVTSVKPSTVDAVTSHQTRLIGTTQTPNSNQNSQHVDFAKTLHVEEIEANLPQPQVLLQTEQQVQPKGILKKADIGSRQSFGFKERLNLEEVHVVYGSLLKRHRVELHQDNRLCEKYNLHPNLGDVYQNEAFTYRPKLPAETMTVRSPIHVSVKPKISTSRPGSSQELPKTHGSSSHGPQGMHKTRTSKPKATATPNKTRDVVPVPPKALPRKLPPPPTVTQESGRQVPAMSQIITIPESETDRVIQSLQTGGGLDFLNEMKDLVAVADPELIIRGWKIAGLTPDKLKASWKTGFEQCMALGQLPEGMEIASSEIDAYVDSLCDENGEYIPEMVRQMTAESVGGVDNLIGIGNSETTSVSSQREIESGARTSRFAIEAPSVDETFEAAQEQNEEPLYIDPLLWIDYSIEEINKGRVSRDVRETGMDTVFCLDLSSSMKGHAWQQAIEFITNFLECIQNTTLFDNVYEHIALVTYGSETRVQQHLTCDYVEIHRKLERLKPSGPSPLYAGLHMTHAAIAGAGQLFRMSGYSIEPRVFLITDGKPTPAGKIAGPDEHDKQNLSAKEKDEIVQTVKSIHSKYFGVRIFPVPVGDFDMTLLEEIAKVSKGKLVSPDDWKIQSTVFKNYQRIARVGPLMGTPALAEALLGPLSEIDKAQCEEFLESHTRDLQPEIEDAEDDNLLPLGTRVQKCSSDNSIMSQAGMAVGTVTKHIRTGVLGITWDKPNNGNAREQVKYSPDKMDVVPTDAIRVLTGELIAIGCRVKRGIDWIYGDQDGGIGSYGNVYDVTDNAIIKVRWDCGHKDTYRFGTNGKFELELVGQPSHPVENVTVPKQGQPDKATVDVKKVADTIEELNKRNLVASGPSVPTIEAIATESPIGNNQSAARRTERMNKNAQNSTSLNKNTDSSTRNPEWLNKNSQNATRSNKNTDGALRNTENLTRNSPKPNKNTARNTDSPTSRIQTSNRHDQNHRADTANYAFENDEVASGGVIHASVGNAQGSHRQNPVSMSDETVQHRNKMNHVTTTMSTIQNQSRTNSVADLNEANTKHNVKSRQSERDSHQDKMFPVDDLNQSNVMNSSSGARAISRPHAVDGTHQFSITGNNARSKNDSKLTAGSKNNPNLKTSASISDGYEGTPAVIDAYRGPSSDMGRHGPSRDMGNHGPSSDGGGAIPKTATRRLSSATAAPQALPTVSTVSTPSWSWFEPLTATWHPYSDTNQTKIETSYQKNTAGSVLVMINENQYRVVFSRMEQIDTRTRDRFQIRRT